MMAPNEILQIPMGQNDAGATTVRDYFKALLTALWREEESFSGKHPFGNSAWQYEVYTALIQADALSGTLDQYGYVEDCDDAAADKIIEAAIDAL